MWTLRKEDERKLEHFETWMRRKIERIKWVDRERNEEVLRQRRSKSKLDEETILARTLDEKRMDADGMLWKES